MEGGEMGEVEETIGQTGKQAEGVLTSAWAVAPHQHTGFDAQQRPGDPAPLLFNRQFTPAGISDGPEPNSGASGV